ncbi:2OG-Fe(II) oxygenase superfamily protein [Tenacibaculum sp. MAR_2009_124]|uniref:alpha-ketoglutarate-dependent dioxygenase AlkB n=1 Tax=Tenacibaculum sp. MAR_2009_124 TaxID=1250059 RepID=UPI000899920C|nr:alpha-ketoglutarate-dependent dioxygenase AlkB [Tenacibaculum sp. MAR_2009_124]SEC42016.1 2OG-Fe(II) oxygenase superfamily protein [Tenacibaculum sp. MAR_2009_124]
MILDLNCEIKYKEVFLSEEESDTIYKELSEIKEFTKPFSMILFNGERYQENYGKHMFMDIELFKENKLPSEIWGPSKPWTERLLVIKDRIEEETGHQFQVCVCIYYPDGNSGVDYHSDQVAFGDTSHIVSISLGEERVFHLREKLTQKVHEVVLKKGSLLLMGEHCQERYEHALPLDLNYKQPRINLTFRKFGFD